MAMDIRTSIMATTYVLFYGAIRNNHTRRINLALRTELRRVASSTCWGTLSFFPPPKHINFHTCRVHVAHYGVCVGGGARGGGGGGGAWV